QGGQRPSPNDSRKGSTRRALTALLESWVNGSRDWPIPTGTPSRRRVSAARRWRAANQPRTTGVVSRAQQFPLRPPLAPQASRNTYQIGLHRGSKYERSTTILAALRKGIERRSRCAT